MDKLDRRKFILGSASLAAYSLASGCADAPSESPTGFASRWDTLFDRTWIGPEYWANPLQDWRISQGRLECHYPGQDRSLHLLTRQLGSSQGILTMSVRAGRLGAASIGQGPGSFGFRIGIQGPLREYRNNLIYGRGLDAGLTAQGGLFIGDWTAPVPDSIDLARDSVELRLSLEPAGAGYVVRLSAHDPQTGSSLGETSRNDVEAAALQGNLALVANYGQARPGRPAEEQAAGFWFSDWRLEGTKLEAHDENEFGPILFSHYSLSRGVLKLTAQMPPLGVDESQTVRLEIRPGPAGEWSAAGEADIHPQSRTATFRIPDWKDQADTAYRLAYSLRFRDGASQDRYWEGTIRRDPADQQILTVADISCNIHAAFPNHEYVAKMGRLNPDLLAFVGDQFYESTGGYGVVRTPLEPSILDYLRKWYIHGWTWRELTRDRPSLSLPDDHDVYQGNIWGEGGAGPQETQAAGGYGMDPAWVNVVHRTQTSHHPDPFDPAPALQGISVYYGSLLYGRVNFAVLADRMFKSGPEGMVPPTRSGRGDHVITPGFDPKQADVPEAQLLGERQMLFLAQWAEDSEGADMKAVISQTIFTAMATTHGNERTRLVADYDSNAWPQTPRNQALRLIRKAQAVHIAGDQHLPAVVQYGIEKHRDAGVAFAGPAVNVGYPRWWEPAQAGQNRAPGAPENTGDFRDHFGHPLTVLAVANGAVETSGSVLEVMNQKASGLGLVRFDKTARTITFECWPYLADPTQPGTQFPGWPVTVKQSDNGPPA